MGCSRALPPLYHFSCPLPSLLLCIAYLPWWCCYCSVLHRKRTHRIRVSLWCRRLKLSLFRTLVFCLLSLAAGAFLILIVISISLAISDSASWAHISLLFCWVCRRSWKQVSDSSTAQQGQLQPLLHLTMPLCGSPPKAGMCPFLIAHVTKHSNNSWISHYRSLPRFTDDGSAHIHHIIA